METHLIIFLINHLICWEHSLVFKCSYFFFFFHRQTRQRKKFFQSLNLNTFINLVQFSFHLLYQSQSFINFFYIFRFFQCSLEEREKWNLITIKVSLCSSDTKISTMRKKITFLQFFHWFGWRSQRHFYFWMQHYQKIVI